MGNFDPAGAFSKSQMDSQSIQLNNLVIGETKVKLQQEQIGLQMMQDQQKALKGIVDGTHGSTGTTADTLDTIANVLMTTGKPEAGAKIAGQASTIRHNEQLTEASKQKVLMTDLKTASQIISSVPDSEEGWEQAKFLAKVEGLDKDPQVAKLLEQNYVPAQGGRPSLMKALKDSLMTETQKQNVLLARARTDKVYEDEKSAKIRDQYVKTRTEESKVRTDKLRKIGGSGAAPKPEVVRLAKNMVLEDYTTRNDREGAAVNLYAEDIAQAATDIMSRSSLTREQAIRKAYNEYKSNIAGLTSAHAVAGSTKGNPAQVPKGVTDDNTAKKLLKKGAYYQFPKGIYVWDGEALQDPKDYKEPGDTGEEIDDEDEE